MSAMIVEVYDALRSAGVDDDKAKAAAEAMFNHDHATRGDITRLEKRIIVVEKEVQFIKWGTCVILAFLLVEVVARFAA